MKISRRARRICGCATGHRIAAMLSCAMAVMWLLWPRVAHGETRYVAVTDGVLYARAAPDRGAEVMYQLYRGDAVMTTGEEADGWIEVAVGGDAVWVKAEYLAVKPPEDPKEATITGNGRVALRKAPGGKLIRWLQPGEQITVSAIIAVEGQNWAKTPDGYVMEEYVGLMK